MNDIVENGLYAEIDRLTKRVKELEAEVGRLMLMNPCNHTGFESAPCDICGYPDPRKLIARLEAERDADRRREYGYSQQTVDALTLERDKLTAERNDWKARYQSVAEMHDALIAEFNEMRAENKRLAALNDMFPQEIARLEDRVSAEYEAERADDRARIQELEAERDAAVKWLEEYKSKTYCAYCGATFNIDSDATHVTEHIRTCPHHPMRELEAENDELDRIAVDLCKRKNALKAENKRLRELVDGATEVVEIFPCTSPAQERWREKWLKKAAKAMKEASHEGR